MSNIKVISLRINPHCQQQLDEMIERTEQIRDLKKEYGRREGDETVGRNSMLSQGAVIRIAIDQMHQRVTSKSEKS